MKRATEDVDDLLRLANECLCREEYAEAAALLRKACALAPLRQDIRELLGVALRRQPLPRPDAAVSRFAPRAHSEAPQARDAPPRSNGLQGISAFLQRFVPSNQPPTPTLAEETSAPLRQAPLENSPACNNECPGRTVALPPLCDAPPAASLNDCCEDDSEVFYLRPRGATFGEESSPMPDSLRKSPSVKTGQSSATETTEAKTTSPRVPKTRAHSTPAAEEPPEFCWDLEQLWQTLRKPSARGLAVASVYVFIVSFVALSSGFSYARFFWPAERLQAQGETDVHSSAQTALSSLGAEQSPSSMALSKDEELVRVASDYVMRERYDDAVTLLSPAIENTANKSARDKIVALLATAYDQKGTMLLEEAKLLDSVEAYRRALELRPTCAEYALHLGNAYYYCGKLLTKHTHEHHEKAIESLQRAIELDRRSIQAYRLLGMVYECLKQHPEARAAWDQVCKIAPRSSEAKEAEKRLKMLTLVSSSHKEVKEH